MLSLGTIRSGLAHLARGEVEPIVDYLCGSTPDYPDVVTADCEGTTAVFEVTNDVERHRTAEFGDEKRFLRQFLQHVREADVVWDVGANVGLFTVFAARAGTDVQAFEPEPEFAAHLRRNVELNGQTDRVTVRELALGDESGELELHTAGVDGMSPRLDAGRTDHDRVVSVRAERGANVAAPPPDVLKIDVEGAEATVLDGMDGLLEDVRVVALELHPEMVRNFGGSPDAVQETLSTAGLERTWNEDRNEQRLQVFERTTG